MFLGRISRTFTLRLRAMSTNSSNHQKPLLALPATAEETVKVDVNDTYKLKELGPVGKIKIGSRLFYLLEKLKSIP